MWDASPSPPSLTFQSSSDFYPVSKQSIQDENKLMAKIVF